MKKLDVVLGADNVGKTTLIENVMEDYSHLNIQYHHFSAPGPGEGHLDRYDKWLFHAEQSDHEVFMIDRAWPESIFYEKYRRGVILQEEMVREFEGKVYKVFDEIRFIVMYKPFSWTKPYHEEEISQGHGIGGEKMTILERQVEHRLYYDFMRDYMTRSPRLKDWVVLETYNERGF